MPPARIALLAVRVRVHIPRVGETGGGDAGAQPMEQAVGRWLGSRIRLGDLMLLLR